MKKDFFRQKATKYIKSPVIKKSPLKNENGTKLKEMRKNLNYLQNIWKITSLELKIEEEVNNINYEIVERILPILQKEIYITVKQLINEFGPKRFSVMENNRGMINSKAR